MTPRPIHSRPFWQLALHHLGAPVVDQWKTAALFTGLFFQLIPRFFRAKSWRMAEISHAIVSIGIGSLPIICVATAFAGLVVTDEIAWHMNRALHTIDMVPGFTGQFIIRELGIAVPGLLLAAKVGASITAEVGSMKITEQIDALRLLKIDPIDFLVFPRFVAAIISSACLTLVAIAVTLACAILVAVVRLGFSTSEYLSMLRHFVEVGDLVAAVLKGIAFGGVIPIISCAYGFRCKGGAEGVGTATTHAVVASTLSVIVLDFLLTYLFSFFSLMQSPGPL